MFISVILCCCVFLLFGVYLLFASVCLCFSVAAVDIRGTSRDLRGTFEGLRGTSRGGDEICELAFAVFLILLIMYDCPCLFLPVAV